MRPRATYPLQLGTTRVYLSHDNYEIDWASLAFVAVDEAYAGDYRGAVVVDIGAHKGYYGAYALGHGARDGRVVRAGNGELRASREGRRREARRMAYEAERSRAPYVARLSST